VGQGRGAGKGRAGKGPTSKGRKGEGRQGQGKGGREGGSRHTNPHLLPAPMIFCAVSKSMFDFRSRTAQGI